MFICSYRQYTIPRTIRRSWKIDSRYRNWTVINSLNYNSALLELISNRRNGTEFKHIMGKMPLLSDL